MRKFVIVCWAYLCIVGIISNAQESVAELSSTNVIVAQNHYPDFKLDIDILDLNLDSRQDLWNYNREGYKVADFDVQTPYLYTVEVANTSPASAFLLGSAEIFRTNLDTNERLLLANAHNIKSMILGPRADRAILVQYDQEYVSDSDVLTLGRPNSLCVIIWEQLERGCSPLTIEGSFSPIWISDTAILLQSANGLAVVDTETMNLEIVAQAQTFTEAMRIPQSNSALLIKHERSGDPCEMYSFSSDTNILQSIKAEECQIEPEILNISPDGRFIFLREYAFPNSFGIFDVNTGSLLARHDAPFGMTWGRVFWIGSSRVMAELVFGERRPLYVVFNTSGTPEVVHSVLVGNPEPHDVFVPIQEFNSTND